MNTERERERSDSWVHDIIAQHEGRKVDNKRRIISISNLLVVL